MWQRRNRRSVRLPGYDYTSAGAYFLTMCSFERACLFGGIRHGRMEMDARGDIVRDVLNEVAFRFPTARLDEWVIMPNHVHAIIWLGVGAQFIAPEFEDGTRHSYRGAINRAPTLGEVVRTIKAATTFRIRSAGLGYGVWQRNYYERIIRSQQELEVVREYIRRNPENWGRDDSH